MTSGKFIPAQMKLKDQTTISFDLENKEVGSIHEELLINSDEILTTLEVNVHPPYLFQAATSISNQKKEGEKITIFLSNNKKPLIINYENENKELFYIVMPMISTTN